MEARADLFVGLRKTEASQYDLRRSGKMTWAAVVLSALAELGGKAPLTELYAAVAPHQRARQAEQAGTDWKAIVRQKVQFLCTPVERGVWALPEAA